MLSARPRIGDLFENALAIFAHPDDAELTCFGTLGVLKSRGYRVLLGIVTDGRAGLAAGGVSNRVMEAERASAVMGFELLRGALPDGDLQYSSQLIMQVEQWVRDYEPATVVSPPLGSCTKPKPFSGLYHFTVAETGGPVGEASNRGLLSRGAYPKFIGGE
jgi:GlcNAc-PI de-N-acetylase